MKSIFISKSSSTANEEVFSVQRDPIKFTTRHTASGTLKHVDGTASILGFLPQDMLGRNIFEFYHPEDMLLLKEIYETIMQKRQTAGASFRGKPYRFLSHNGCYVTVETELSSFINPWSHHLEFIVGHHRVLKGPMNPNVLASRQENRPQFPETVLMESKTIQDELLKLLSETVAKPLDSVKQQVSRRCQVLASFMESLMDDVKTSEAKGDLKIELPQETDLAFSERDSVMLGEISPHHEYFDSKSSSETMPSYNQLNYNENLQRFFDSKPVTDIELLKLQPTEVEVDSRADLSPTQCFGESAGSESGGNMSSASYANMGFITNTSTGTSNGSYVSPTLTEALLCKHNENMEKLIIKRHKVSRTVGKNKKGHEKSHEQQTQGVKRSGSHSWEGEANKTSKQQHITDNSPSRATYVIPQLTKIQPFPNANVALWPPFSVSTTSIQNTLTPVHSTHFSNSPMFPAIYYIPQNMALQDQRMMPGVLYQPMVYQHPSTFYQMQFPPSAHVNESIFNSSFQFEKSNIAVPILPKIPTPIGSLNSLNNLAYQRPPSQATSVKADMGSTSASVLNRV